jgi:hypothetical protein
VQRIRVQLCPKNGSRSLCALAGVNKGCGSLYFSCSAQNDAWLNSICYKYLMLTAIHFCVSRAAVTAGGLLALLEENDNTLRTHALTKLADVVDQYWAEVSSAVPLIEELSEDPSFPARELAASVASKCFFHLEEYNDALRLALGAGKHFDVSAKTEYVSTLVSRCIDEYIALRTQSEEVSADAFLI